VVTINPVGLWNSPSTVKGRLVQRTNETLNGERGEGKKKERKNPFVKTVFQRERRVHGHHQTVPTKRNCLKCRLKKDTKVNGGRHDHRKGGRKKGKLANYTDKSWGGPY